ncbi:50S ribosomal protein L11 methyltransferase [Alteromonas oceanisediminis]|uniref:50S ribosomal protein L11 methyltransferase n=1 Tax=Alteromonas oceanisediminis TaxID=2836180 RepID=UPI001BD98E9E|nr:50S ribosomal protein L11 methyltransferase [Alteromonas oceanisediminis]MBT0586237.1 50S ribosomal protein L11 methyltransferase [Alteromonas oceanisediminis]
MAWLQLIIDTHPERANAIGDWLEMQEAQAVTFLDAKDTPTYEPKPGEVLLWPDTRIIGLYDADHDMEALVSQLHSSGLLASSDKIKTEQLEDKDWIREWMDSFHPMQFGQRLWICPSWRDVPYPDAVNVMLDPGLAFGTGTHPTTALCLEWLDGLTLNDAQVVDFGCGSGILGVAALKLGAKHCVGIDIDPQALLATKDNAQRNGVDSQFDVYLPEHQPQVQADVVVANILSGPLLALREVITAYCQPGGKLVLSGILAEQVEKIEAAYAADFDLAPAKIHGDWARVSGTRR